MANFTKAQIQNFLENRIAAAWRGETEPAKANIKWLSLKVFKILVDNDIITPAQVNAAFPEFP